MQTRLMRKVLFALGLLFQSSLLFGAQNVGGMIIDYGPTFKANEEKAQAWQAKMADELRSLIQRLEIFEAPSSGGLGELRLLKVHYVSKTFGSIDDAASETVRNIVALPGIKNPVQRITASVVSGLDARRVSFESDRYDGKLGAEFLIVHDKKTNTLFQLQIIFSKRPSVNPFGSTNLNAERATATVILSSVAMARL
jgi:hypothetical protein